MHYALHSTPYHRCVYYTHCYCSVRVLQLLVELGGLGELPPQTVDLVVVHSLHLQHRLLLLHHQSIDVES